MHLVISEFTSLDGVVQAPGGPGEDDSGGFAHGGWSAPYFDAEVMGATIDEVMQGTDAMLFGRRTWQVSATAWPQQSGDPFADRINALPKYVASRTLGAEEVAATWAGSSLLPADETGDAIGAVRRLKEQEGGALQVYGSAALVRDLVAHDLVDEYRLMLEPILLGGGKRAFPEDGRARPLELVSVQRAATGVLVLSYRRVR